MTTPDISFTCVEDGGAYIYNPEWGADGGATISAARCARIVTAFLDGHRVVDVSPQPDGTYTIMCDERGVAVPITLGDYMALINFCMNTEALP